jgi:hypothetical protein
MNKPVSYSMAKLLDSKEVRFENWQGKIFVDGEEQPHMASWYVGAKEILIRPTIADVVMWLYEKHGIWIYSYPVQPLVLDDEEYPKTVWVVKCLSMNQIMFEKFIDAKNCLAINHHASPTDAYESAFEYALNNLI